MQSWKASGLLTGPHRNILFLFCKICYSYAEVSEVIYIEGHKDF